MTEQQIKEIKAWLSASQAQANSAELDGKILAAAKLRAAELKALKGERSAFFRPFGFLATAAMSITLTIGVFLTMSKIIGIEEAPLVLANKAVQRNEIVTAEGDSAAKEFVAMTNDKLIRPDANKLPALQHPFQGRFQGPLASTKDEIMAELPLPSVNVLLDSMEFSVAVDRSQTQSLLSQAMAEINFMLREGEVIAARKRYERLRQSCTVCKLPSTLEALAQVDSTYPDTLNSTLF